MSQVTENDDPKPKPSAKSLTDLPPELLDHITSYLPTAQSLSNLSLTSRDLNTFVEKDAWHTFARARFHSLHPNNTIYPGKDVARTLTTLSRAWDRRAFVSRYIEPFGDIRTFPGNQKVERWYRPRGQTIGFTPHLDCYEEIGSSWAERREILAFSAGSSVCVRETRQGGAHGGDRTRWMTYRPFSAREGKDDVTTFHLMRPHEGLSQDEVQFVTGTPNGDLQLTSISSRCSGEDVPKTYFTTQGMGVRSSSLLQGPSHPHLLAASLDDTRLCLYPVDSTKSKIEPINQVELLRPTNGQRTFRAWSTNFLSATHLAVGVGPSEEPIHIYTLSPTGLSAIPLRKFALQNHLDKLEGGTTLSNSAKKNSSSVYSIIPLPPSVSAAAGHTTNIFLSGAYDGIIRLHDLRSSRDVEAAYVDPTDDSAIYSLLPRGREKLIAGTSRHAMMKVFDLRLGAKAYSYLDACNPDSDDSPGEPAATRARQEHNWNLFLKPNSATYSGRGAGNNWARRSAESSVYSLTSPSPSNPHIFAGVENAVLEMAFTGIADGHQDATFFGAEQGDVKGWRDGEVAELAMYEQLEGLSLMAQMSVRAVRWGLELKEREMSRLQGRAAGTFEALPGLDERWRAGGSQGVARGM